MMSEKSVLPGVADNLLSAAERRVQEAEVQGRRFSGTGANMVGAAKQMGETVEKASTSAFDKLGALSDYLEKLDDMMEKRKPGEMKSAGEKPKQPSAEKATPAKDEAAAKKSAAARGVDAPAREVTRQR